MVKSMTSLDKYVREYVATYDNGATVIIRQDTWMRAVEYALCGGSDIPTAKLLKLERIK